MEPCPINSAGDLQLESVLSPLLFFQTDFNSHDVMTPASFRGARILDYGCGSGRLLDALATYSLGVLAHIDYVGWDMSASAIARAKKVAERDRVGAAYVAPLSGRLRSCHIGLAPMDLATISEGQYDVIVLVNVLHHLDAATTLPEFIREALRLLRIGGYLVIEDFFLGEYPSALDVKNIYHCQGATYWGPAELSAIFCSGWGAPGSFRFFKRYHVGAPWYGYTYVLYNKGRIAYFPGYNRDGSRLLPGVHFALTTMVRRALAAKDHDSWYVQYADRLTKYLNDGRFKRVAFERDEDLYSIHDKEGLEQIYKYEDPYPEYRQEGTG